MEETNPSRKKMFAKKSGAKVGSIRKRRNFSINDIRGSATQPTITHFEKNGADIGFTLFHTLINNLYIYTQMNFSHFLIQKATTIFPIL